MVHGLMDLTVMQKTGRLASWQKETTVVMLTSLETVTETEEDGKIEAFRMEQFSFFGNESEGIVNVDAMNERFYGEDADLLEGGCEFFY